MFFKSSLDKIYNLENRKQKIVKNLIKEDPNLSQIGLNELINTITIYNNNKFRLIPNQLYDNDSLIDVSKESKSLLLEMFDMNGLYETLNANYSYEKAKFNNNDEFRRDIMNASLYEIISTGGKIKGPEYGLIFAKMFNYNIEIPMRYASYNGIFDERFMKYLDTYLELGGSDKIYWLPYYFNDDKNKYTMEPLYEIIELIKEHININKVNSIN